jgi:CheY-like chemotaxis protein
MSTLSKNMIFYITIIENDKTDHTFLRKVIHNVVPHAIVDSVYNDAEAVQYFNNCSTLPHLILLDQNMLNVSGKNTVELIKRVDGLDRVPIVYLTKANISTHSLQQGADHYYSKPYGAQDLLNIVGSLNSTWLA